MTGPVRTAVDLLADVMAGHVVGYGMSLDHEHVQAVIDALIELAAFRDCGTPQALNAGALADAGLLQVVTRACLERDAANAAPGTTEEGVA